MNDLIKKCHFRQVILGISSYLVSKSCKELDVLSLMIESPMFECCRTGKYFSWPINCGGVFERTMKLQFRGCYDESSYD